MSLPFVGKKEADQSEAPSKAPVIPSIGAISQVRRVHEQSIEDLGGSRYAVWSVEGMDSKSPQVINGWMLMLNSIEYPIQILIRQHSPDLSEVRRNLMDARPESMREGRIGNVGQSLLDYLQDMETGCGVVSRRWYVVANYDQAMELDTLFSQAGFQSHRLQDDELELLLQACVSGMGFGHSQDFYQVQENSNHLELNHRYMAVYEVDRWPRRVSLLFLEGLLRLGDEMDVSMWFWPASQRESHSRLQMQRSRFEGSKLVSEQKGKLVSEEVKLAIDDVARIAENVERGTSKLFRRTTTVAVYGRTMKEMEEAGERLSSHFRASLAKINLLKLRQGAGFGIMMPTLRCGLGKVDLTDTDTLVRMFPFGPLDMTGTEGTLLGMDLRSRTPIIHNPFSPAAMNGHMVVMARSGAGKSFFTKLRVARECQLDIRTYLIDPEGEYGVIVRQLGGRVFVPGSPGHGMNPFIVSYTGDRGDLTSRISSLGSLVGVMLEGEVNVDLKSSIDRCLTGFYMRHEMPEITDADPVMGRSGIRGFYDYLQTEETAEWGGQKLAHLLSRFATGSARYLMQDSPHNLLEDEAPVTSFNLKNLAGPLKPVATSICSEVVWSLAVSHPRPRRLVVDECWTVLATPSGAEALINIVKRARKYQLGLLTITQDVQDFLAENSSGNITGHAGRSLLQNSAMKLALSQDPAALPQVVDALGLSSDDGNFLASSLRGQGLLINESGVCFPIEITSTSAERELVLDDSWRQDGASLIVPEATLEPLDPDSVDVDAIVERVRREREGDE